jgi:hypothetical protein
MRLRKLENDGINRSLNSIKKRKGTCGTKMGDWATQLKLFEAKLNYYLIHVILLRSQGVATVK